MVCSEKKCRILLVVLLFLAFVALALLLVFFVEDKTRTPPQARTQNAGIVLGKTVVLKDGETQIHEFHNIRYAKAPVGDLRFRPPVRHMVHVPDEGVEAADNTTVMCVQADSGLGTEDCLVLTVRSGDLTASKPVLMWIHGGGLAVGYGTGKGYSFDSEITHRLDAVTVNINYRLGFLGFSSIKELWDEDAGVYANNGIRDMIAALDWIQDNIAAFGGDPNSVTVIGESGGATAVLALTCSPLAYKKFHAGIAQSPAPEMRFTHEQGNEFQRDILAQAGCTQQTAAERKQCLLDLPANKFSFPGGVTVMKGSAYFDFPLSQGEDNEYVGLIMIDPIVVTVSPRNLESASFTPSKRLPVIISNLAEENYDIEKWPLSPPFSTVAELKEKLQPLFENISKNEAVMNTVIDLYPEQDPTTVWSLMTCDMRSTCPSNDVAEAMSTAMNMDVYRLYVTHKPSIGVPAFHFYDSFAFFGYIFEGFDYIPNEMDLKFQTHYIEMVKKFARDKKFDDGWGTFPGKSMTYENSEEISKIESTKPQQTVCEKLSELDLVIFGWQNK